MGLKILKDVLNTHGKELHVEDLTAYAFPFWVKMYKENIIDNICDVNVDLLSDNDEPIKKLLILCDEENMSLKKWIKIISDYSQFE